MGENDGDRFGRSIALSDDGETLVVGAPGNDENGDGSGLIQLFRRSNASEFLRVGNNKYLVIPLPFPQMERPSLQAPMFLLGLVM